MGTPDFAVLPLKKIVEAGFDVVGVVTNPDKPAGRGQKIQASSVKKYALEQGIPLLQPEKFRDEVFFAESGGLEGRFAIGCCFQNAAGSGLGDASFRNH